MVYLVSILFFATISNGQRKIEPTNPLQRLRTLNDYLPFEVPDDLKSWQRRRTQLQNHLLVNLGLWPLPEKTPLKPVIHGKLVFEDYSVEKVFFQSMPGFYVTGNLYRPLAKKNRETKLMPAVLCPHGHWSNGRFMFANDATTKQQLGKKAERFEANARSPLQARCAGLARRGCVVFHYDMIGYADSQQIPYGLAHGFRTQRKDLNSTNKWGLFSPHAEMRSQSVMGLQTWNSIRALDFVSSLPEVDRNRIAVTGASGGGTQTFILCAIDPRPAVAFPAVMVSTGMQGGCTCENCSNLRVGQGNVEFAAMFAPKPMGLTAADDWTKEMATKGMPELKQLYRLYGKPENVSLLNRTEFGHNYNRVSRLAMYDWFHRHLKSDKLDDEKEITILRSDKLSVFNEKYPKPKGGTDWETSFLKAWSERNQRQMGLTQIQYTADLVRLHPVYTEALKRLVCLKEKPSRLKLLEKKKLSEGRIIYTRALLYSDHHSCISQAYLLESTDVKNPKRFTICLSGNKFPAKGELGGLTFDLRPIWENKSRVAGLERLKSSRQSDREKQNQLDVNSLVPNGREAAGYSFGYNRTVFAWRAQQIYDMVRYLKESEPDAKVDIFCDEYAFPVAIYVAAMSDRFTIDAVKYEENGLSKKPFRFRTVSSLKQQHFVPGILKFGDIDGLITMAIANGTSVSVPNENEKTLPNATRVSRLLGREPSIDQRKWESRVGDHRVLDW